ncbi:DUF6470 family protein [Texcoconibacillus texcoconensis]|uniref:YviE n=1 Tax=Texcoconibacillus texcoconensis TaxID=1095777 RepID=A0A840QQY0_9BACI|nr:DUF6470 family protein [Texcoconibacillus texcoconensis]MBB5173760.1 hypothetical protein [Texcoconibacillus texcoconensis]
MQVPQIQMNSQTAQIGMQSQRPQMQVQQPEADLSIQQQHGGMTIHKQDGQLSIDQSQAFAEANLIGPLRSSDEFAAQASQAAFQYAAKVAQQGEMLKQIESGQPAIPEIARQDGILDPPPQVTHGWMPSSAFSVQFDYNAGDINVDAQPDNLDIHVNKNDPMIDIPRWQRDVYLEQKNNLTIDVVGTNVNRHL